MTILFSMQSTTLVYILYVYFTGMPEGLGGGGALAPHFFLQVKKSI